MKTVDIQWLFVTDAFFGPKIITAGINPIDAYQAHAGFFVTYYPFVGGYDAAGIVEEIGEGVTNFVKGEKV